MSTPNKFYALLESTVPDPQRLEDINKKPLSEINYLICFTPRSGSTLLTEVLSSTGMMGVPEEWFNPRDVVPYVLKGKLPQCNSVTDYVNCIRRKFSTSNKVFGCEVTPFDLSLVLEKASLSALFGDDLLFISLIREDFVSQAISLYKATKTGIWHTTSHKLENFINADRELEYNREEIKRWLKHILDQEYGAEKLFKSMAVEPLRLTYEKLVADTLGCVKEIATYIGVTLPDSFSISKTRNEKVATSLNKQFKERFMAEEKHFVQLCHELRGTVPAHLIEKKAEKLLNQTTKGQQLEILTSFARIVSSDNNEFTIGGNVLQIPKKVKPPHSWIEHIPFAFFLIHTLKPRVLVELGVYVGNSYNAFCQAVSILNTATQCYGIDTWRGDEHSNFYDDSVYNELFAYQQREYQSFSSLLRMTFDEARNRFADGTIDLLHIDGFHTYEAVKHDFDNWLPKVSNQGVVIFHDTEVRDHDFGVWRLWEEVAQTYPSFNFKHGYGLGVIAVGSQVPPEFLNFLQAANQEPFYQELFARLGHYITLSEKNKTLEKAVSSSSHLFAQLFIDTGEGFEERQSLIKTVTGEESQLEFDLSKYQGIQCLRFDPLNDLTAIEIQQTLLVDENGTSQQVAHYQTNSRLQRGNQFWFDHRDPQLILDWQASSKPQRIIFQLTYLAIGNDTYRRALSEMQNLILLAEAPTIAPPETQMQPSEPAVPRYFAQLFVDTGLGFSEEQSILQPITGEESQLEFDVSGYQEIQRVRFDPLNDLTMLELEQMLVLDDQGTLHQVQAVDYQTNAIYTEKVCLMFKTIDPQIVINVQQISRPLKVIFRLKYLTMGEDPYRLLWEMERENHRQLEEKIWQLEQVIQQQTQAV